MKTAEEQILTIFKNNSSKNLNAEFIAKELYSEEYNAIENLLNSSDPMHVQNAKRRKFQLHRKILYYLNKFVDANILKVEKITEKGEKHFALNITQDTIIEKGYKKIILSKPQLNDSYVDQYELNGVVKKYSEDSWINRINSMILECDKNYDVSKLYKLLNECYIVVNDAIGLNDFENVINNNSLEDVKLFLDKIVKDTENYDKTLSLIITISNTNNNIIGFIKYFSQKNPQKVNIIFNTSNKDLQKQSKIFETIIQQFSESKIKINIKNSELSKAPYFKGRAGIYNFNEDDWELYIKKYKGSTIGLCCSMSQIVININRFFEIYNTDSEFRKACLDISKALLFANNIQKRRSNEYFKSINQLNYPNQADFFRFSRNYVRFWNYDWHKDIDENTNLFELIKSTKELVENFCYSEETIYKSCGIPIRFKIGFSSAFRNFDEKFMGEREYKKANVKGAQDYYSGEIKEFITAREKMFEIFDGGDRLRVFRTIDFKEHDIIHEISILLNAYKVPFFTYDFSGLRGTIKLTNFL